MAELDINQDTVCFLSEKARLFHCKEEVVIPEVPDSPSDDWALQVLADHSGDTTFQEFKATIEDLEPDQQQAVVALMWVGRGDFSVEEWPAALEEAADSWNEYTAEYLIAHPLLADYLEEGLAAFGYSCNP
ncbi:DUF3775 domain-containing protein [Sedimenticola hydrogenitrophicus]|uniref:DUF3775 domain-containing protein n=1 Tax=Sedimenticola hydrogenitrophicus TaxID=2967975 RepID=UPI0023AEE87A|nr:DUF3775 domain-containing protein [Sedimenticola hydrogenitrophicus]